MSVNSAYNAAEKAKSHASRLDFKENIPENSIYEAIMAETPNACFMVEKPFYKGQGGEIDYLNELLKQLQDISSKFSCTNTYYIDTCGARIQEDTTGETQTIQLTHRETALDECKLRVNPTKPTAILTESGDLDCIVLPTNIDGMAVILTSDKDKSANYQLTKIGFIFGIREPDVD